MNDATVKVDLSQAEKIVKILVGKLFTANLSDKSPPVQRDLVPQTTGFLRYINNDAIKGPISCTKEGQIVLTAEGIAAIGKALQKTLPGLS